MKVKGLHIIRGGVGTPAVGQRAKSDAGDVSRETSPDDGRLGTLQVAFSRFQTWYRIDDLWEGTFLERTLPGAFKRTIANNGRSVKVLFNHGMDMNIGDKVLSTPELIEERADSPYLEGPLFDTSYNRDLLPGLRAGAYGSSFMFEVLNEYWNYEPEKSADNPDGLPERSITEVRLHEAGPVTWPANPDATASLRSGAAWFGDQLARRDPARHDDLVRSLAAFRAVHRLPDPKTPAPGVDPVRHVAGMSVSARRRRMTLIDMEKR